MMIFSINKNKFKNMASSLKKEKKGSLKNLLVTKDLLLSLSEKVKRRKGE